MPSVNRDLKVFISLWVIAFFCFLEGWNAGWILDSIMHSYNVRDISCSEYLSLHIDNTIRLFYHFTYYWLEKLLGPKGWDWYLFKISLHSLNAFLFFKTANRLLENYAKTSYGYIPYFSAILFLLSPTSTDVVMYQASFHFMMAFALLQCCILLFFRQLERVRLGNDFLFYTAFLLALFTLETSYMLCIVMCLLIFFLSDEYLKIRRVLTFKYVLIPLVMTLVRILLNEIILNDLVGHYGAEKHFRFGMDRIVQNIAKIPLDLFGFIEYWDMNNIYAVYDILYNHQYICLLAVLFFIIYFGLAYYVLKRDKSDKLFLLLLNISLVFALPTLSLGILYIIPVEEDRYYYMYAPFVYMLGLLLLYRLSVGISYVAFFVLLVVGFLCLIKNVSNSALAQRIIDTSLAEFPFHKDKRYVILAMPVYANGVIVWDTKEPTDNPFDERWQMMAKALKVTKNVDLHGKIASVLQYNVISDKDAPIIEKLDSNAIRMTLPCCGKWWWKHNAGALDYQNEYFKVEILGGWQQEVKITFINKPDDIVYLFQDGTVFKEWKW